MKKLDIVIARYKESISWIDQLVDGDSNISVHVYNKHEGKNLLPNVGREAHTYLHHITENYQEVKDTIFLQGHPYDHEIPKGNIKKFIVDYFENRHEDTRFFSFNSDTFFIDKNGYPTRRPIPLPIGAMYEKIFTEKSSPEVFTWNPGACFYASKKSIKDNQLENYKIMMELLSKSSNPVEGHCAERMWRTLFEGCSEKKIIDIYKDENGNLVKGFPKNYPDSCTENNEIKTLHQNLMGKEYLYYRGRNQ